MVEFALVIPILMMVVFASIEFGDAYWKFQQLSAAASEGARKAIVSRTDTTKQTTITNAVKDAAPGLIEDSINVYNDAPGWSGTWTPGNSVTIRATYPETINIVGIPVSTFNLSNTRTMRIEQ